jgi:hypothetical protein
MGMSDEQRESIMEKLPERDLKCQDRRKTMRPQK